MTKLLEMEEVIEIDEGDIKHPGKEISNAEEYICSGRSCKEATHQRGH
jgi:hypothetical protein